MNTRLFRLAALVLLMCCAGCYSLPKQRGTWSGVGRSVVLYDAKRSGCSCAVLEIKDGPALKKYVPQKVVLVDSKLKTFSPDAYAGKSIRVTGLIVNEYPTCAATGELLLGDRHNWEGQFGAIYVLRVSKIESH
jgi:hypothetical protein